MKTRHKFTTYLLIVILPLIILSIIFWMYLEQSIHKERQDQAEWVGSVCQEYIDEVISETKENLELLSLSSSVLYMEDKKTKLLMNWIKDTDPRYAGVYWLNQDGISISGTNKDFLHYFLIEQDDIDKAVETQKAVVVGKRELNNSSFNYFTIFAPILDNDKKVQGFLLAHIRLDYIENGLKMLIPNQSVKLETSNKTRILEINAEGVTGNSTWVNVPLTEVDWTFSVKMPDRLNTINMNVFLIFVFFTFFITHMIYIVVEEQIVRREKKKQKQLNEMQKIDFVGTLAASTAHEIKNPLTGIKGLVQLLVEKHPEEQDQFYYSVIMKEIERINSIVSEFLILGKPIVHTLSLYDIRSIIAELRPIIESEARYLNIELEWNIVKEPIMVYCTKDQLKQVILNITKNGLEAMELGKKLTIQIYRENEKAKIEIIDTGHGLNEKDISKVFEPFYTSKKEGTGLGLFVCKRIIELFNGTIELTSKPLKGTTVIISLPILNDNLE
ncbi:MULTISPECIES: ATP-binding protein [unclassified Peribacillus]|uniref:ATP-binding protein n=2 Tax=Peribacillus TaxID=2675229 RepID=UPI001912A0FF|nr:MULTISPECIES: ATP-binding protein [unclassified Peribacillus]MBK5459593.1 two-component sensor histidine kinase [Peribacillus sp. TH27]MBK5481402.1 two-component sensor histidine kinase [Peribacillus sp. TH16]MBK5497782.1 two-component sensor histidine kinase [Peribacillus sp. TH14]